jgi:hypothetical protein
MFVSIPSIESPNRGEFIVELRRLGFLPLEGHSGEEMTRAIKRYDELRVQYEAQAA